jgi:transcriptional regulator of acetoin/glycerol metabolism
LKLYLDALLRRFEGNVSHAAKQAGIERESLHRLLRKADLDAAYYRR